MENLFIRYFLSILDLKPKITKGKKKQEMEKESSEMAEGTLGKLIASVTNEKKQKTTKNENKKTANGEKKSIKSEDYPEDSKFYSEKDQAHAVLEVDGAEIDESDESAQGKSQNMFADKSKSRDNMEEFEINPRLEVTPDIANNGLLNEAGIEKAVEEALKQRSDKNENHENEFAFVGSDKHGTSSELEGHGTEVSNRASKQIEEQEPTTRANGNDTVLEMNKIANEAGQVAMNLVNVTNFKVVIPGGKTYEISGSPGKKPLVTVVPDDHSVMLGNEVKKLNETTSAKLNTPKAETIENGKGRESTSETADGKTVTAIQHGNQIDVHVDKKTDNLAMQIPQITATKMDNSAAAINSPIMAAPILDYPHPILDSAVASLMYHPDHVPIEHPPISEHPQISDHPVLDHHEPHPEDMHIEVNSTLPAHEAPKPQKLDPEVIKVEFLPEGISVDTASSKITKKCNHEASKRSQQSSECKEESKDDKSKETEKAETKTIADQTKTKTNNMITNKVVAAPEAKMFVAPLTVNGVPGDVTVVPAERQEAVTRVLVQDTAGEKNDSKVNVVKMAPMSKVTEPSSFPVSKYHLR